MELPNREPGDVYWPDGTLTQAMQDLRGLPAVRDLRVGIVSAFDYRTRMLPFWYADTRMAPCAARTLGDVLHTSGFEHVRVVLQQWTPNFKPSRALLGGRPLDLLLVSAMQVHAEPSYDLIRDAYAMGDQRPLILAGGPKAIYEPTDYFNLGPNESVGADCVVTGEAIILVHLLQTLLKSMAPGETARTAFDRARACGSLAAVPGLAYLSPESEPSQPIAIHTGVQRLVRDLDEMPLSVSGYGMLERPHHGRGLKATPLPARRVAWYTPIASILTTIGCRFRCSFCPIPAANQRTWRHKSPERFAAEIKALHQTYRLRSFFGTDDNFFNDRETALSLLGQVADTMVDGKRLGKRILFYTQATEFDVYKNRDILRACRRGGLRGIWFGIEDLTGGLIKKGQSAAKTSALFALLRDLGIESNAMMIHSDAQPLRSQGGDLSGLLNQARYVYNAGAVSYQCTYLGPAMGTRDIEPAATARGIYRRVGGRDVPQAFQDGNHVVASRHMRPWNQQLNLIRGYAAFYNPLNVWRAALGYRGDRVSRKRLVFQIGGQIGLALTVPKLLKWAWQLRRGPIEPWDGVPPATIPILDATTGREINWGIKRPLTRNVKEMLGSATVLADRQETDGAASDVAPQLAADSVT